MKEKIPMFDSYPEGSIETIKLIKRGSDKLIISFPALHGYQSLSSITKEYKGFDHLSIKCPPKSWMTRGDGTHTHSLYDLIELINEYRDDYKDITLIGSSAGGFGATAIAHMIDVDRIVLFDPLMRPYFNCSPTVSAIIPNVEYSVKVNKHKLGHMVGHFSKDGIDQNSKAKYSKFGIKCFDTASDKHGMSIRDIVSKGELLNVLWGYPN